MDSVPIEKMEEKGTQNAHMVAMPRWFLILRGAQLGVGLLILALSGWLIAHTSTLIDFPDAYGLTMFTSIATLIVLVYFFVSSFAVHAAYNYWAYLALEAFMVLFWLVSMATLAALRSSFVIPYDGPVIYKRVVRVAGRTHLNVLTTTTVISALELILFIVSAILFTINLLNHRKTNSTTNASTTEGHNMQSVAQAQPLMQQPQNVHQQQTAYQPQYAQPQMQGQPQHQQPQQYQQPYPQQQQQQQYAQPQYQQPQYVQPQHQQPQYQQPQQQPQQAYQQPIQSDQEKIAVEHPHQAPPQYPQQPHGAPYGNVTPVSSPPPTHT